MSENMGDMLAYLEHRYAENARENSALFKELRDEFDAAHHERRLLSCYLEIINQYCSICQESNLNNWNIEYRGFNFVERLRESITYCDKTSGSLKLMNALNKLAKEWDLELDTRHKNKQTNESNLAVQDKQQDRRHSHRFMLMKSDRPYCYSIMFNDKFHSDIKLICICVTDDISFMERLFFSLHEVGHYIGCRQREEVRSDLFVDLTVFAFLEELYHRCSHVFASDFILTNLPLSASNLSTISPRIALLAIKYRETLEGMANIFRDIIMQEYSKLSNVYDKFAWRFYLFDMAIIMQCALGTALPYIKEALEKVPTHTEITTHIVKAIEEIMRLGDGVFEYQWLEDVKTELSEPAADVFMVKVANMSARKYLEMTIQTGWHHYLETKGNPTDAYSFCRMMSSQPYRTRILALCTVLKARRRDFVFHGGWSNDYSRARKQAGLMLFAMYMEERKFEKLRIHVGKGEMYKSGEYSQQDIWNPQYPISCYAEGIANDELYKNIVGKQYSVSIINYLRMFKASGFRCFRLKDLLWSAAIHAKQLLKVSRSSSSE